MVGRMAADLDTALLHVAQLIPRQITLRADEVRDHVDLAFHAALFEERQGHRIIVLVAIVEGDDQRFLGKRSLALRRLGKFQHGDRLVAFGLQMVELRSKIRRRHEVALRQRIPVVHAVGNVMVFEDEHALRRMQPGIGGEQEGGEQGDSQRIRNHASCHFKLPLPVRPPMRRAFAGDD